MATERQKIDAADKLTIAALLRRIEAARNFPVNTDPAVRHVQIMGETLGAGLPYPMLDEERGHCAISLLAVVAGLYETRNVEHAAKVVAAHFAEGVTPDAAAVAVLHEALAELENAK
jgi:hypothetical protein